MLYISLVTVGENILMLLLGGMLVLPNMDTGVYKQNVALYNYKYYVMKREQASYDLKYSNEGEQGER